METSVAVVGFALDAGVELAGGAVAGVGDDVVDGSVAARTEKGAASDFNDFLDKVPLVVCNNRVIESLIKAGAFDSFGYGRRSLVAVHEGTDGCVVQAAIPSSMTTWTGKLSMTLERRPEGALVSSAVVFEGQSSDWGRSKRVLDDLHQEILNYRSLQP